MASSGKMNDFCWIFLNQVVQEVFPLVNPEPKFWNMALVKKEAVPSALTLVSSDLVGFACSLNNEFIAGQPLVVMFHMNSILVYAWEIDHQTPVSC